MKFSVKKKKKKTSNLSFVNKCKGNFRKPLYFNIYKKEKA